MYKLQNNSCAICKRELTMKWIEGTIKNNLSFRQIDHIKNTLKIRGLLCSKCNAGIGFFDHNPNFLRNAANYVEKPPLKVGERKTKKFPTIQLKYKGIYRGVVRWIWTGEFRAQITIEGIVHHLGSFSYAEEAALEYNKKLLSLYPDIDAKYLNNIPDNWKPGLNLEF